jgi:DNA-binding NarL/FixJ family response regulator
MATNASRRAAVSIFTRGNNSSPVKAGPIDSNANAPMSIADKTAIVVIDRRVLIRDCLVRCLSTANENYVVLAFATVPEWLQVAAKHPAAAVIVLCAQDFSHANVQIERDLSLLSRSWARIPVVVVADSEGLDHVIAALESGARGYIPTSVTLDVAVEAMHLIRAGGTFVPATRLVSSSDAGQSGVMQHFGNLFTRRQTAVLEALCHGKANKEIAYQLNMREGTVKVHVRNIMKKLKAKNRTEVAVLTSSFFANAKGD